MKKLYSTIKKISKTEQPQFFELRLPNHIFKTAFLQTFIQINCQRLDKNVLWWIEGRAYLKISTENDEPRIPYRALRSKIMANKMTH